VNVQRVREILDATTVTLPTDNTHPARARAGHIIVRTVILLDPPPVPDDVTVVDLVLTRVAVDQRAAGSYRGALVQQLRRWPVGPMIPALSAAPNHALVAVPFGGDEDAALRLIGLGAVLGLWDVILPGTPAVAGIPRYVMLSGWTSPTA
jgi:hypothetical protein